MAVMTAGRDFVVGELPSGLIQDRVTEAFKDADAARSAYLDKRCREDFAREKRGMSPEAKAKQKATRERNKAIRDSWKAGALAILLGGFLAGCADTGRDSNVTGGSIVGVIVTPGDSTDLRADFAKALACDPASLSWSIREAGNPGFASPRDGAISQAGVFTAPVCGSAYVGATLHVEATGCGVTGMAAIATAQEVVSVLDVYAAVVSPGTPGACLARGSLSGPFPLSVSVPIGGTAAFYSRITMTCGSTIVPTPPASWPQACP